MPIALPADGKWDEARATLIPLLGEASETGQRMRMEALELELFILQQLPKDSAQRGVVMANITERIEGLRKEPLKALALVRLAEISLAVTLPGAAAQIYHQLALREPGRRPSWLALAQNNVAAAQRLGRQLVALKPRDAGVLLKQFELEGAATDLPAALALASRGDRTRAGASAR